LGNSRESERQLTICVPGLYRYSYKSHMIFYTIEPDYVFIVRVLYAGADFKRHF
jgi:plasmid stabilization system protein ParE